MGWGATAVRDENRDTAFVDRSSPGCLPDSNVVAADRCAEAGRDVAFPAADERQDHAVDEAEAAAQVNPGEVALHDLWSALSRQEQIQFGGRFSRMLLRAVQFQITSTTESIP